MIGLEALFSNKSDKKRIGIGGWVADVRLNESIEFKSDVPDNYVEDGSVINDHIINNPVVLNIEGEVSDLHIKPFFLSDFFVKPIDKAAGILNAVFPFKLTNQATQKIKKVAINATDKAKQLESYYKNIENLYKLYENKNELLRKEFIEFLNRVFCTKELITIETPFGTYKNMRIISLTLTKDNKTDEALSYKITAKEVRFAKTIYIKNSSVYFNPSLSVANDISSKKQKGVVQGESKSFKNKEEQKSFLYTLLKG